MESGLPSAKDVLIIRPTGNTGSGSSCLSMGLRFPGAPARKHTAPKQDQNFKWSERSVVVSKFVAVEEAAGYIFSKSPFPGRFKEPY